MVKFDNWFEILPGTKAKTAGQPKVELFADDDPVFRPRLLLLLDLILQVFRAGFCCRLLAM